MTRTGHTEEEEFREIYGMDIVEIPTYRPVQHIDREDRMFRTKKEKLEAVCEDVLACREKRYPVLVERASVSDSEELSRLFAERGIRHHALNMKRHKQEATIVAKAGPRRGYYCHQHGRPGDPGESRFYLSLDNGLLRIYGRGNLAARFEALGAAWGEGVTDRVLTRAVDRAQKRVESDPFAQRRELLKYDRVLHEQREVIYAHRLRVLHEPDIHGMIVSLPQHAVEDVAVGDCGGHVGPDAFQPVCAGGKSGLCALKREFTGYPLARGFGPMVREHQGSL